MKDCAHNTTATQETEKETIETCNDCGEVWKTVKTQTVAPAATTTQSIVPIDNSPYGRISSALKTKAVTEQVRLALGYTVADDAAKAEAFKYISSVLMEIQKSTSDDKKDLTKCTSDSIVQSIIDAASYRLPIDGRGLAYLVKYNNRASFQPGYKGMLYKIAEQYKDVDFTAEPVFEGDTLDLSDNGGFQTYKHTRANPFQADISKMTGVIACLSYSTDAGRHSKVVAIPKAEIEQIRSSAKQDFIWKAWFFEKAKAAALKRLCKIHMTTALGIQELAQFDNEEHFELPAHSNDITPAKPTEKLNSILEKGAA